MPPYPGWRRGRDAVADSWLMPGGAPPRLRYARTAVNGQPAVGTYLIDPDLGAYMPLALDVLTLRRRAGQRRDRVPDAGDVRALGATGEDRGLGLRAQPGAAAGAARGSISIASATSS